MKQTFPLRREAIGDGVYFGSITDSRFKTNLLTVNLVLPLERETVTENALLPLALEKCWEEFPTRLKFAKHLNTLYDASAGSGVVKLGDSEILTLSFSAIDSAYALHGEDLMDEGAKTLLGLLLRPVVKNSGLEAENLNLQRQYLNDSIQAEIHDKRGYALSQTVRAMFAGDPCALNRLGYVEDAEKITPESALAAYRRVLDQSRIEILHVGMGDPSAARKRFAGAFSGASRHPQPLRETRLRTAPQTPKEVAEEKPVAQAKLCLGFHTGVNAKSPMASAMRLMSALLGGCTTSRLFVNVREKRSLCYYCSSRFDQSKGALVIDSGVEKSKAKEAREAILEEVDALRRGDFTDEELRFARLSLQNSLRSVGDTVYGLDSYYLSRVLQDMPETPEDQCQQLDAVTREEIVQAAKLLALDTVYLLAGPEEGGNGHEE